MSKVLYLKAEQSVEVSKRDVTIKDVAKLECTEQSMLNRLNTEKLFTMKSEKGSRKVVSVLFLVEKIHEIYPDLEVQNLGESDVVVSYHGKKQSKPLEILKISFVSAVSFFGSMFAMMTFNEDVSTRETFDKLYTWVMGSEPPGISILEITYSIGVSVGIIVFFNHIGKKYITNEPSPVEVEMAGYEQQVNQTLIKQVSRKGKELDVD